MLQPAREYEKEGSAIPLPQDFEGAMCFCTVLGPAKKKERSPNWEVLIDGGLPG